MMRPRISSNIPRKIQKREYQWVETQWTNVHSFLNDAAKDGWIVVPGTCVRDESRYFVLMERIVTMEYGTD